MNKKSMVGIVSLMLMVLALSACAGGAVQTVAPEAAYGSTGGGDGFEGDGDFAGAPAPAEEPAAGEAFSPDDAANRAAVGDTATGVDQGQIDRLIIRTGSITVQVDNTRDAKESIDAMVAGMAAEGAYVVSSSEYGGTQETSPYISITIRVPAGRFDEVMDRVAGLAVQGTNPTRNESGQDVTEEFVDLQARLESLEAARERLLEIMENSQTTEELLYAEQQLTQREAEIEAIKGRMQYLQQSSALSSISIELQPYVLSQPVDTTWRPAETVREALEDLLGSLRTVGDALIYLAIFCGPWLLVIIPVGYGLYRFVRSRMRRRNRRAAAPPAAES